MARAVGVFGLVSVLMTLVCSVAGIGVGVASILVATVIAQLVGMAVTGDWFPWRVIWG